MSAAPAAALLAALAVAALLATHTWSVAADRAVLLVVALRAPARRRWPYLIGTLIDRADGVPAHAVRRGDRLASDLDRPDDPGARQARRDDARSSRTGSSRASGSWRSASRSPSTRCCSTTTACSHRPAGRGARRSPSRSRPGSCRCSSATRATCASRSAAAAWSSARCGSSRRSSPARSSAGSTSPRRWRRAATVAPSARARRAAPWSWLDRLALVGVGRVIVVVAASWL